MEQITRPTILGIPFDQVNMRDAVVRTRAAFNGNRLFHVATAGPEFLMASRHDPKFAAVMQQADLTIPDGFGVILAARLLGHQGLHRIPGMEYLEETMMACVQDGVSIFLYGAQPGVAEDAARNLVRRYPNLQIAGIENGFRGWLRIPDTYVCWRVRKSGARLLLVALGAPRQEFWIDRNRHQLGQARVAIGVGGAFDFWAGRIRRAPIIFRKVGLEWLWRFMQEPRKRSRRIYYATWKFLQAVLQEKRGHHA